MFSVHSVVKKFLRTLKELEPMTFTTPPRINVLFVLIVTLFACNENKYSDEDVAGSDGLQVLNSDFAKDSVQAYYHKLPIEGSDPASFVALDQFYAKDKKNLYYCNDNSYLNTWPLTWEPAKERRSIEIVDSTESASFISLGLGYVKGQSKVFLDGKKIRVADVKSFRVLISDVAVDDKQAYVKGKPIRGSDGKTFVLIGEEDTTCCGHYGQDSKSIYFISTEKVYAIPSIKRGFKILGNSFSLDEQFVFFENKKLPDVDPNSFRFLDEHFSTDGKSVYYHEKKLKEADPQKFKVFRYKILDTNFSSAYSTDGKLVFWQNSVVRTADPATFSVIADNSEYAKDKSQVFFHDKKIEGDPETFDVSMVEAQ